MDRIVTIATTPVCEYMADRLQDSARCKLNQDVIILRKSDFPLHVLREIERFNLPDMLLKCWLPEALCNIGIDFDRLMWMDSDTLFIKGCNPFKYVEGKKFGAVRDWPRVQKDADDIGVLVNEYFNSGVMVFDPERHDAMFKAAWLLRQFKKTAYPGEQGCLNAARRALDVPIRWMASQWNSIEYHYTRQESAIIAHLNRVSTLPIEKVTELYKTL